MDFEKNSLQLSGSVFSGVKEGLELSMVNTNLTYRSSTKDLEQNQHRLTVGSVDGSKIALPKAFSRTPGPLPGFGGGKPYPPVLPDDGAYLVDFDGDDDPLHPQNWPTRRKLCVVAALAVTITASIIGSGITAPATGAISSAFHISNIVGNLGTSLYMLGYAIGPILWAPWSELQGRRVPMLVSTFSFSVFQISASCAKDIQTILVCQFWSGFFGASSLVIVGGAFSDMFDNRRRGLFITYFTTIVFACPLLASLFGSYMIENGIKWYWTERAVGIAGFGATVLSVLLLEETYPPILLVSKARQLRLLTKNWGIHAKQEEIEIDFSELVTKNFTRPFVILFTEPIMLFITVYLSFIYGLVYLSLASYPVVFQQVHGMKLGVSTLPGLGSIAGTVMAAIYIGLLQPAYSKKLFSNGGIPIPEWRLPAAILGGFVFSVGLFLFGWTGYKSTIPWIIPTLAGVLVGFGTYLIFIPLLNYLIDAYLVVAASAMAANCFLRSMTAAAFPLFSHIMFERMGVQWVFTLLGCIATLLLPIPIVLYYHGSKIRARSKLSS